MMLTGLSTAAGLCARAAEQASPEEEARIGETAAVFANKIYVSPLPGGARITFAETRHVSGEDRAVPRAAVFLQHADLAALRRLLDWTAGAAEMPDAAGGSMHQAAPRSTARPACRTA